jgi:DNA-binding transcriptional MerR regulator
VDGGREQWFGPGETARRLGVTIKALRVYEREGLVTPQRAQSGWRIYGPNQMVRLHHIIVLRDLGLPLDAIRKLLGSRSHLPEVLGLQRESLMAQRVKVDRALILIEAAQRRLKEGCNISLDDLATLTRETVMQQPTLIKEFETRFKALVAERDPTGSASKILENLKDGSGQALYAEIAGVLSEARPLLEAGEYNSEVAEKIVLRFLDKTANIKRLPEADRNVIRGAYEAVVSETGVRPKPPMPLDAEALTFIREVAKGMRERGELT